MPEGTGFELIAPSDAKMATPEKALFDTLYLGPARSRIFAKLPELTISRKFQWGLLRKYVSLVKSASRRTFLEERISALMGQSIQR